MAHAQAETLPDEPYRPNDYSRLITDTPFSKTMMETHLDLYAGYVEHTNKALDLLRQDSLDPYAATEVRRRFAWEHNGMRLHEYYFDALGGPGGTPEGPAKDALETGFGSWRAWRDGFRTVGSTRGVGWAALVQDPRSGRLLNTWIDEHDAGLLAGTHILLVLDLFEHAFIRDFGTDRGAYMDAFFGTLDWGVVDRRLQAPHETAPPSRT